MIQCSLLDGANCFMKTFVDSNSTADSWGEPVYFSSAYAVPALTSCVTCGFWSQVLFQKPRTVQAKAIQWAPEHQLPKTPPSLNPQAASDFGQADAPRLVCVSI